MSNVESQEQLVTDQSPLQVGSHPSPLVRGTSSNPTPRGGPMIPAVTWTIRPRSGNSILGSLSSCASCCRHARRARHWGHREVSSWALIVPVHVERHIHPAVRGSARGISRLVRCRQHCLRLRHRPRRLPPFQRSTANCHCSNYTPGRDGTRNAARRPGSGVRPRGGFEEQGGHVRVYRGGSIP